MNPSLPAEIWLNIFDLAIHDERIYDHYLPTSMSESSWYKLLYGEWALRSPHEAIEMLQRRSFVTKKAIVSTCRSWRLLANEFLFRCLFLTEPAHIQRLAVIFRREPGLGWWTKRIHITRYYSGGGASMEDLQNSLVTIIRCCPNLEIFVVNWSLSNTLSAVIGALCGYRSTSLRTLHLSIPAAALAKIIMMLESLPFLVSAHIEFDGHPPDSIHLGAAAGLFLTLPALQQLSLRGPFQDFLEQAMIWTMPSLNSLTLDFINYREDLPDIVEFLTHHGSQLTFLDINCIPPLDVATILDFCPLLTTFAFNLDWRLPEGTPFHPTTSLLTHIPHPNITTIGCHQLLYAFGVGYAATYATIDPLSTHLIRRRNDANFNAITKANFPRLQRVRVLNRTLLRDLESANGPATECFQRWERWWDQCASQHVRLEDCTGALLGTLPPTDEEDDQTTSMSESSPDSMQPIRDLLEECRLMDAEDDQP